MRHLFQRLSLMTILLITACGAPVAQPVQTATSVSQVDATVVATALPPGPQDSLRWSLEGVDTLASLDPAEPVNTASNTVIGLVFSGLIRLDEHLEVQPDGAERWTVSDDGLVYTFFLRDDLRFADGTAVTANDFKYSINRALAPETASYGAPFQLGEIAGALDVVEGRATMASGVQVLDQHVLEIRLHKPQAHFLAQLAYPYTFVVPQSLVESSADWEQNAFGTGPYKVRSWTPGQSIVLEANEHYWRGQPGLSTVEFFFYPQSEQAVQDYLAGKLDVMGGQQTPIPANYLETVQHLPDFKTSAALVTRYIGFNNQRQPFDDPAVRQAFAVVTDKQTLVETVLAGAAEPAQRILPTGLLGTELPLRPLAYDPAQAQQLLSTAGYANGSPAIELAYGKEGDNQRVAEYLGSQWSEQLGVEINVQGYDINTFVELLNTTYFTPAEGLQMYLSVWGADYPDPHNFLSQQLRSQAPNNNGHFSNADFDRLVDRADRLDKPEELDQRLQLYNNAEQIAVDQVGWLPLYYPTFNTLIRADLEGLVVTPIGIVVPDWTKLRRL